MIKRFILSGLTLALITGCASIVSKSNYPVMISSSPDQAEFLIINKQGVTVHSGKTPATVTLKSGCGYFSSEEYSVCFKKSGYADTTTIITGTLDGWYFGNIIFGGLIGILIVDPITGAMWKLPESASGSLTEEQTAEIGTDRTLSIVELGDVPDEIKGALIRIN